MFCTNCRARVTFGAKFCTRCGRPLAQPAVVAPLEQALDPTSFELAIGRVFVFLGYQVQHTGRSGDGGVDLRLTRSDGTSAIVQCKKYAGTVGPAPIRELYGALVHEGADTAYLVTTGRFSMEAQTWARGKPLVLVDGAQLARLLQQSEAAERMSADSVGSAAQHVSNELTAVMDLVKWKEAVERLSAAIVEFGDFAKDLSWGTSVSSLFLVGHLDAMDAATGALRDARPGYPLAELHSIGSSIASELEAATGVLRRAIERDERIDHRYADNFHAAFERIGEFLAEVDRVFAVAETLPSASGRGPRPRGWRFWRR